jgi:5-methyltetrahydrofolate--homocysteine methyltransferase
MNFSLEELIAAAPVLTDGAWGTQLQARGLAPGEFPDLWNLRWPNRVHEVARNYVEAGSQVILTNTFGANQFRLKEINAQKQVREINCAGVWLSQNAAGAKARVFASMGPSGKMIFSGDVTFDQLRHGFGVQAEAFAEAGADAVVIETMSEIDEARAALSAVRDAGLPAIVCMVFDSGKEKDRTMMGNTPEEVAAELTKAGASAIGANCGHGIATAINVCRRLAAASNLPIWMKPNAGLPELSAGGIEYKTTAHDFASHIPALVEAGAAFVGGCCGSNPDFIRQIAAILKTNPAVKCA